MHFILKPLIKNGLMLFYILLSIIAFTFTFRQKVYHKSVLDKTTTQISGNVDERMSNITHYIGLKDENRKLQLENSRLLKEVEMLKGEIKELDTLPAFTKPKRNCAPLRHS